MERDFEAEAFKLVVDHSRAGGSFTAERRRFDDCIPIGAPVASHKLIEAASKRLTAIPHALNLAVANASQVENERARLGTALDAYIKSLDAVRRLAGPPLDVSAINESLVTATAIRSHLCALAACGSAIPTLEKMRDA